MYYVTFMNEDNEFICCQCGTFVDEEDGSYSLEQIEQMFIYDFNSEQLGYFKKPSDISFDIEHGTEPKIDKSWKEAVNMLWEAMVYPDDEAQILIKRTFEGFTDLKALLRMVRDSY